MGPVCLRTCCIRCVGWALAACVIYARTDEALGRSVQGVTNLLRLVVITGVYCYQPSTHFSSRLKQPTLPICSQRWSEWFDTNNIKRPKRYRQTEQRTRVTLDVYELFTMLGFCHLINTLCYNKSVFSLVLRLSTWHCTHLLLNAVLRHRYCWAPGTVNRYVLPARRSQQIRCTASRCWCQMTGQTDGRTLDRFTDPASHAMRAVSKIRMLRTMCWHNNVTNTFHLQRRYKTILTILGNL